MNEEIKLTEVEQLEDVVHEESQQPVIIQPKITPPRVLLEVLIYGGYEPGTDPKESNVFKKALNLQQQIDSLRGKDKFRVRILWKGIEAQGPISYDQSKECEEWLIENSSCKYYYIVPYKFDWLIEFPATYIKNKLKAIKDFEKSLQTFKSVGLQIKKK